MAHGLRPAIPIAVAIIIPIVAVVAATGDEFAVQRVDDRERVIGDAVAEAGADIGQVVYESEAMIR